MRKVEARGCVEVKAAVTEVLDSKTDYIYDGGARRECERQAWRERREMMEDLQRLRPGRCTPLVRDDRDDVDDVLPRRDYYAETTTKVRARYAVDGRVYESEVVLSDEDSRRLAGKKIYLTLDPARPEEPLGASRYKSKGGDRIFLLLAYGAVALITIFCLTYFQWGLHPA